jgi:adenylate kinase
VKVIVLLGAPGAGKGTQAALIASRLGGVHISTGALLREEIKSGSQLGQKVKAIVESGSLVDDQTLFDCCSGVLSRAREAKKKILLLDGVPRNVTQVKILDSVLENLNLKVDAALDFEVPTNLLVARLSNRWTCQNCGAIASGNSEGLAPSSCNSCQAVGSFARRKDDEPSSVEKRLGVYVTETAPVSGMYNSRGLLHRVDANQEPELVYLDVGTVITKKLK